MAKRDLNMEVLVQIRDELRSNGEQIKRTNTELQKTREELSDRIENLAPRQVETEVRLATELVAVSGGIKDLARMIGEDAPRSPTS